MPLLNGVLEDGMGSQAPFLLSQLLNQEDVLGWAGRDKAESVPVGRHLFLCCYFWASGSRVSLVGERQGL